jgi:hypothetical protein
MIMRDKHRKKDASQELESADNDHIESPFNVSIVLTSWFPPAIRVSWSFNPSKESLNTMTTVTVETEEGGDKNAPTDSRGNGIVVSVPTLKSSRLSGSMKTSKDHEETTGSSPSISSSASTLHSMIPSKSLLKMFHIRYNPIGSRSVTSLSECHSSLSL